MVYFGAMRVESVTPAPRQACRNTRGAFIDTDECVRSPFSAPV